METLHTPTQTIADWCWAVHWEAERPHYSSICCEYSCLLQHGIVTGHVVPDVQKDLSRFILGIKQIQDESSGFAWPWWWRHFEPQQHCCDNLKSNDICYCAVRVRPPTLKIPSLEPELVLIDLEYHYHQIGCLLHYASSFIENIWPLCTSCQY